MLICIQKKFEKLSHSLLLKLQTNARLHSDCDWVWNCVQSLWLRLSIGMFWALTKKNKAISIIHHCQQRTTNWLKWKAQISCTAELLACYSEKRQSWLHFHIILHFLLHTIYFCSSCNHTLNTIPSSIL